ncbi:MAG: hypothetical protein WCY88_07250 [Spongiibacteraceae bacterium]
MSLGSWDPDAEQDKASFQLDLELLKRFIAISQTNQLDQLNKLLSTTEQQIYSAIMQTEQAQWSAITTDLTEAQLVQLMRFFTVAEKLPGWEAGANSPVIYLGKILKQRGIGINRELVLWIKAHSDNQFLPHGPL